MRALILMSILSFPLWSAAETPSSCPNLSGEYVFDRCPVASKNYYTVKLHQPNCFSIGRQNIYNDPAGKVLNSAHVDWMPIANGSVLVREDGQKSYSVERFFDKDVLYTHHWELNKTSGVLTFVDSGAIALVRDGNLLISKSGLSSGHWINLKNCRP